MKNMGELHVGDDFPAGTTFLYIPEGGDGKPTVYDASRGTRAPHPLKQIRTMLMRNNSM